MAEIVIKNGGTPKQKKRLPGIVRFLIGFIITILIIVALLVAALYICFFDNSHKATNVKADYPNEEVFNEVLVDSLDNTISTKQMQIAINQDQLTQVLYNAFNDKPQVTQFVKNIYVEADNAKYDFVIEANAYSVFSSRLTLNTALEISDTNILFKVNNVRLGRIDGVQNILSFIENFITIPNLDEALQSSGLHMHFDIHNLSISYELNDFYNDLINLMGASDYTSIFYELISQNDLRDITAKGQNIFEIDVNIDKLKLTDATHGITGFNIKDGYFNNAIAKAKTNTIKLLNANKIQEKDATTVARYFIGENALLEEAEKTIISNYASSGIFDEFAAEIPYYDYTGDASENLKQVAAEQIIPQNPLINNHVEVEFDSDMLDKMFETSTSLGKINVFVRNKGSKENKDYKFNFVVVDRISTLINGDNIYFSLSLNLNGCSGQMTLKTTKITDPSLGFGVMKLRIDSMLLGDKAVSETTKNTFLEVISTALQNGAFDERFKIGTDGVITLDLKKTLDENNVLESIGYSTTFSLVSATNEGVYIPGAIKVAADR